MVVHRFGVTVGLAALVLAPGAGACASGGDVGPGPSGRPYDDASGGSTSGYTGDEGSGDEYNYGDDGTTSSSGTTSGSSSTSSGLGTTSGTTTSSGSTSSSSGTTTTSSGTTTTTSSSSTSSSGGGPAPMGFSVQYQAMTTGTSAYIGAELNVINEATSTSTVEGSALTLRYYFLADGYPTPTMNINWAHLSIPGQADQQISVSTSFGTISPAVTGADTYAQFSFSAVSNFAPGQNIEFSWQMQSANPASQQYNQSADYSYNASDTQLTATQTVVLFDNGSVASGTPPP